MRATNDGQQNSRGFPTSAGILLGLGLAGFFDGIVLHQVLQWHHMLSSWRYPTDTIHNLKVDILWDGLFHATTYIFVGIGLVILWREASRRHITWSGKMLAGTLLLGFGAFNMVEGIIDHVNETVPRSQWLWWDMGFLACGAAMIIGGWFLLQAGKRETANQLSIVHTVHPPAE